jgi:hypothetical protein
MDSSLEQSLTLMMMIENHTAPARSSKDTRDFYRVFGIFERLQQKHGLLHPKYNPQRSGCGDLQTELQLPSIELPHEEVLLSLPSLLSLSSSPPLWAYRWSLPFHHLQQQPAKSCCCCCCKELVVRRLLLPATTWWRTPV